MRAAAWKMLARNGECKQEVESGLSPLGPLLASVKSDEVGFWNEKQHPTICSLELRACCPTGRCCHGRELTEEGAPQAQRKAPTLFPPHPSHLCLPFPSRFPTTEPNVELVGREKCSYQSLTRQSVHSGLPAGRYVR